MQQNYSNSSMLNCDSNLPVKWGRLTTNKTSSHCTSTQYTGTVCRDVLTTWQLCAMGNEGVYINESVGSTQNQKEQEIVDLTASLGNNSMELTNR